MIDIQPSRIHDGRFDENPTKSWGRKPAPGTAQVYVFPEAKDGRGLADVVRLDKGLVQPRWVSSPDGGSTARIDRFGCIDEHYATAAPAGCDGLVSFRPGRLGRHPSYRVNRLR